MIRKKLLNLFAVKAIRLHFIWFIFFSGSSCFSSSNEFTLKEQEIRKSHQALKGVVESFYARIEERSFFKPPVPRFPKKNQKPFDIKTRINFCSMGVQHIVSIEGKVQAKPFQVVTDPEDERMMIASSSSADQWEIATQTDTDFHLLAWPTRGKESLFLTYDFLRTEASKRFLTGLKLSQLIEDPRFKDVFKEMENFFLRIQNILQKVVVNNSNPFVNLSKNEWNSLVVYNGLIKNHRFIKKKSSPKDPPLIYSQQDVQRHLDFISKKEYMNKDQYGNYPVFIEHILSVDMQNKLQDALVSPEIKKYSHFLGVSLEEYKTYRGGNSNPLQTIRFNSENDEHSEPLLAAWVQRYRKIQEETLRAKNPQEKLLQSVYFLYTHRSTCQNCEQVNHRLISQTPLLISFLALYEKDDVGNFSNIEGLSLTTSDLERLSVYEKPMNIKDWKKGIVRIPVQYQIGE